MQASAMRFPNTLGRLIDNEWPLPDGYNFALKASMSFWFNESNPSVPLFKEKDIRIGLQYYVRQRDFPRVWQCLHLLVWMGSDSGTGMGKVTWALRRLWTIVLEDRVGPFDADVVELLGFIVRWENILKLAVRNRSRNKKIELPQPVAKSDLFRVLYRLVLRPAERLCSLMRALGPPSFENHVRACILSNDAVGAMTRGFDNDPFDGRFEACREIIPSSRLLAVNLIVQLMDSGAGNSSDRELMRMAALMAATTDPDEPMVRDVKGADVPSFDTFPDPRNLMTNQLPFNGSADRLHARGDNSPEARRIFYEKARISGRNVPKVMEKALPSAVRAYAKGKGLSDSEADAEVASFLRDLQLAPAFEPPVFSAAAATAAPAANADYGQEPPAKMRRITTPNGPDQDGIDWLVSGVPSRALTNIGKNAPACIFKDKFIKLYLKKDDADYARAVYMGLMAECDQLPESVEVRAGVVPATFPAQLANNDGQAKVFKKLACKTVYVLVLGEWTDLVSLSKLTPNELATLTPAQYAQVLRLIFAAHAAQSSDVIPSNMGLRRSSRRMAAFDFNRRNTITIPNFAAKRWNKFRAGLEAAYDAATLQRTIDALASANPRVFTRFEVPAEFPGSSAVSMDTSD